MDYQAAIDFLYSSLPMYQRIGRAAYKSDLATTLSLDRYFGYPHRAFRTIHVAGTNGKGSVSHMLAAILQTAGYKTGLYTSPHYIDFRERIRVNGRMADRQYVVDFVEGNKEIIEELNPSFFEMTAAMAFDYFKKREVDIAVIETGMGGRLDSTNIITPEISVITNIGFDHMQYLGDTLEKIAVEKAGIIKEKVPVTVGYAGEGVRKVFLDRAAEMKSEIYFAGENYRAVRKNKDKQGDRQVFTVYRHGKSLMEELSTDMTGDFQAQNIITVLQLTEVLKDKLGLNEAIIRAGLDNVKGITGFTGRWQIIRRSPLVICDSGHNADGLKASLAQLKKMKGRKLHIVLGLVNDKDTGSLLILFPRNARYYFTRAGIPRALDQQVLRAEAARYSLKGNAYGSVDEAFNAALRKAGDEDIIFVGGSTFIVADLLKSL
ncbi:MAG: bifunctional folylpolyglutamate synthase/dihydrofolate synthase [Bacteroidales bacterium]|nr:bifunctional folylpolyglutamate synthase/dihydrofolate synthase [Bacteroidales bacterium]